LCSYGKKHTVPAVPDRDLPPEADRDIKVIPSVMSIVDRIGIAGLMNLLKEKKMSEKFIEVRYTVRVPVSFDPEDGLSYDEEIQVLEKAEALIAAKEIIPEMFYGGEYLK
jgi:hypothetical protein